MFLSLHAPPTPFHHTAVKTKHTARSAPGTVGTAAGAFLTGISNEQFTVERTEIKTHALYIQIYMQQEKHRKRFIRTTEMQKIKETYRIPVNNIFIFFFWICSRVINKLVQCTKTESSTSAVHCVTHCQEARNLWAAYFSPVVFDWATNTIWTSHPDEYAKILCYLIRHFYK